MTIRAFSESAIRHALANVKKWGTPILDDDIANDGHPYVDDEELYERGLVTFDTADGPLKLTDEGRRLLEGAS